MSNRRTKNAGAARTRSKSAADAGAATSIAFLFEWNVEITRFYLSRFQKYGLLPWRLQGCRSPEDFARLQAEFQSQLVEDYRQEAARLSRIVGASEHRAGEADGSAYAAGLLKAQEDAAAIIEQAKAQAESIVAAARDRAAKSAPTPKRVAKKRA